MAVHAQSPQLVSFTDEPFDTIAEMAQGWDMRYQQLEPGPNVCAMTQLRLGRVDVGREELSRAVAIQGTAPIGSVVFGLLAEPSGELTFRGRRASPDTIVYNPSSEELDHRARGALLSFVVDTDVLAAYMGHTALHAALRQDRVTLTPNHAQALRTLSAAALSEFQMRPELHGSPAACGALADQLLTQLVDALRGPAGSRDRVARTGPRPLRLAAAKEAEEFILRNLDRRLPVDDLVRMTDVGRSALRAGFVQRFGHGPQAHISALRLNAVRRTLRAAAPGASVTGAATRFGFWHLGRFAQAYRRLFGELPSSTLAGVAEDNRGDSG